jgi:hypothetical protein
LVIGKKGDGREIRNPKYEIRNKGGASKRGASLEFTRSGVHPEGFSSGDSSGDITGTITGTTLKGVKRGSPRRVHPEGR